MAGNVASRDHDLEPQKLGVPEAPIPHQPNCGGGDASSRGGGSNPIAKIRSVVRRIDLVQPAATKVMPGSRHDREFESGPVLKRRYLCLEPRTGFFDRVSGMTPRHPRLELGQRFPHGLEHESRVIQLIRSNANG